MKKAFLAALVSCLTGFSRAEDPKVEHKPINLGAAEEFGNIPEGLYGAVPAEISKNEWIDHFQAWFNKQVVVEDRLHLSAGLWGAFQFRKPEGPPGLIFDAQQRKAFFIGPSTTEAVYHFGDLDKPWLKLGMGWFPYKYNPEAANLGEYLFRSGAYPTYVHTGGYMVVNNSAVMLQGLKANFQFGDLHADLLFTTETTLAPLYDFSLAGVLGYKPGRGFLDLGLGVNLHHLVPVKPSRSTPTGDPNGYFTYGNVEYSANTSFYSSQANFDTTLAGRLERSDPAGNAARIQSLRASAAHNDSVAKLVTALVKSDTAAQLALNLTPTSRDKLGIKYYSSSAVMVMARATLDFKTLFDSGIFGEQDLKVFGEIDVLGIQNQPIFYKNVTERMPIMGGINLPAFRLLDLLSVQVEYFNSPYLNNTLPRGIGEGNGNIPFFPQPSDEVYSMNAYNDAATKDNFKWSVLAKKTVLKNITLSAQVARDHLRLTSSTYYFGPQFSPNEVTAFENQWYWMGQLSWGI